jgi:eukaryotic-like serine/threonine-protein kinase
MDSQRWERMKQVFSAAVALGPTEARVRLASECAGDPELLAHAHQMLEEHFRWSDSQATLATAPVGDTLLDASAVPAGRFRVVGRLGSGSFGDVFCVADEANGGAQLALKVLRSPDPVALQYFKREFRSLAGVNHPNLVVLHELIAEGDRWMYSMEFIDGVDLIAFLGSVPLAERRDAIGSCFLQLAEGLRALHDRHLLHRDLKPSNVLVTGAGRLVLLDFGLIHQLAGNQQHAATFAGTPGYMSPEQVSGETLGRASDWYAVGVMLYQALAGRLPFEVDSYAALRRKILERVVPPAEFVPGVPMDLNDLCVHLLEPQPLRRASYSDLVRVLAPAAAPVAASEPVGMPLIGRDEPLRWLEEAFTAAEARPILVHLCGSSGIGKSAFLREWMERLERRPATLVFAGRCFEGESVPYQAIDDLIDSIAQYLRRLPAGQVERFLPRNFAALVKMFPVLAVFRAGPAAAPASLDSVELRTRAFSAFRELLGRLAEVHRVVLVIDDLQWGDADGCAALRDLLSSVDAPPALVVLSYRSEDVEASPWLGTLRDLRIPQSGKSPTFIYLDRLDGAEAAEVARVLLSGPGDAAAVQQIVAQSGGNPFLVREMVRWIHAQGTESLAQPFSLSDVVRSRVNSLAAESRRLLDLLAVAGQPTGLSILNAAAGVSNLVAARDELVAARLVRVRSTVGRDEMEVYHDRIRAAITAELDSETLAQRHREIAAGLETATDSDPERIAVHYEKAGEPLLCTQYALQAARRAAQVLAFHKAAFFFKMALATETLDAADRRAVLRECADALANAGRGPEAAERYLEACEGASSVDEHLELKLLAAEQLLFTGHIDRGLAIFEIVLRQVGLALPKTVGRIPLGLLWRRFQLRLRGLRWKEIPAESVPRQVLLKVDTCASVAIGLSMVDIARGATLQTTSLLLALQAGEPARIARAMAMEAAYRSTPGVKVKRGPLLDLARELGTRTGDRRALGLTAAMAASCAWTSGRWEECYRLAHSAREEIENRPERAIWERDTAVIFEVSALRWLGRWALMKALLPGFLEDARMRGDLYVQAPLTLEGAACSALADDDPDRARAVVTFLEHWSKEGFHLEHLIELHNQLEISLYVGNGAEAMARVNKRWAALRRSLLLLVQPLRIQMSCIHARAAICAAGQEKSESARRELLAMAGRDIRTIRRQDAGWGMGLAELLQGGIDALSGRDEPAIQAYQRAQKLFDEAQMFLHSAAARRNRGLVTGGDAGRALVAEADRDFTSESILNPARLTAGFAPGIPSESN